MDSGVPTIVVVLQTLKVPNTAIVSISCKHNGYFSIRQHHRWGPFECVKDQTGKHLKHLFFCFHVNHMRAVRLARSRQISSNYHKTLKGLCNAELM